MKSCAVCRRCRYVRTSPNRSEDHGTGKGKRRKRLRSMVTGDGCRVPGVSAYSGNAGNAERNFAHQFDTGGMDRLWVRGKGNVRKKVLLQAAGCNLALLMRSLYGAGKPKAAHDRIQEVILATLAFLAALSCLGRLRGPTAPASRRFRPTHWPKPRFCLARE